MFNKTSLYGKKTEIENIDIENAAISNLLSYPTQSRIYIPKIQPDYFFNPTNQAIFKSIKKLTEDNEAVEIITVSKDTGIKNSVLTGIVSSNLTIQSALPSYIKALKEYADKRWFYDRISKINEKKIENDLAELSVDISNRIKEGTSEKPNIRDIIHEFSEYQEINRKHFESGGKYIGHPTGFQTIDDLISGIRKGHYWVITAYSNTGKSTFLLNVASKLLNDGKRVLFFSLEMSRVQNIARILGIRTNIKVEEIEKGTLFGDRLDKEIEVKAVLYDQKLTLYNSKRSIDDIIITILAEHSAEPVDAVFIDYLQKIQNNAVSRYEKYTISSDKIQKLSQELSIPIIIASQVDNDSAKNRNNDIIATKGSGDVAGDVDFAVLLRRNENDPVVIDGIVQKNRHGMRGIFALRFFEGGQLLEEPL